MTRFGTPFTLELSEESWVTFTKNKRDPDGGDRDYVVFRHASASWHHRADEELVFVFEAEVSQSKRCLFEWTRIAVSESVMDKACAAQVKLS